MKIRYLFLMNFVFITQMLHSSMHPQTVSWNQVSKLHHINQVHSLKKASAEQNDLVIGANDPYEVVTITGDYLQNGTITIVNNGLLRILNANFQVNGDISITGNGRMTVTSSTFTVIQEYIYEHDAILTEEAKLIFDQVDFRSSGQSWSIAVAGHARYDMQNSNVQDGFITITFAQQGTGNIQHCTVPGEFLCFEEGSVNITHSDFLLMWLVLPENSEVSQTLPSDSLVTDWEFSEDEPGIKGLEWQASIDSCTNVMWGLISTSGSDAKFTDTEFRTIGLMFNNPDSVYVSNITNESSHADDIIPIDDRDLHLVNSTVHTWSFYTSGQANVTIENCVFGEVMVMDTSRAWVENSICDGTGGYASAFQNGFLLFAGSLVRSPFIARDNSTVVAAMSSILGSEIDADESAVMFLANTDWQVEPEAHTSAIIFEAQMPPVYGTVNALVEVPGTARIIHGPESPVEFLGYRVKYGAPALWVPVHNRQPDPVVDGTLAQWNTAGLVPGYYDLELTLFHSYGDSISMNSWARLDANTGIVASVPDMHHDFELSPNYPNPFNASTIVPLTLLTQAEVHICLYDIRGSLAKQVLSKRLPAGHYEIPVDGVGLASGIYHCVIEVNDRRETRPLLYVK